MGCAARAAGAPLRQPAPCFVRARNVHMWQERWPPMSPLPLLHTSPLHPPSPPHPRPALPHYPDSPTGQGGCVRVQLRGPAELLGSGAPRICQAAGARRVPVRSVRGCALRQPHWPPIPNPASGNWHACMCRLRGCACVFEPARTPAPCQCTGRYIQLHRLSAAQVGLLPALHQPHGAGAGVPGRPAVPLHAHQARCAWRAGAGGRHPASAGPPWQDACACCGGQRALPACLQPACSCPTTCHLAPSLPALQACHLCLALTT